VFLIKTDDAKLYISALLFSNLVVVIYIGLLLNVKIHFLRKQNISIASFKENISSGIVLMIGNFSNNLFTSIDRWLVKILMTTFSFATYSFAISIDALINVFIQPLFVTLYNAFCKDYSSDRVLNIKRLVLMWGFIIILLAFPAKWFVENYIDKYNAAIPLIFILFCTQVLYAIIKGVYVNYFKALNMQKQYLRQILIMLIIGIVFSLLLYITSKTMMSLAVAGLLTAIIWLMVNEIRFKELRFNRNDWIYFTTLIAIYIVSGLYLPSILGFFVYLISLIALSAFFMRQQTNMLLEMLKPKLLSVIHKYHDKK
jgi:O-antigen/teichoic acid export membrane protein